MDTEAKQAVYWHAHEDGYEVTAMAEDGMNVLDHYSAGNHQLDSQANATVAADRVPLRTLRKYARQTALEIASEQGIPRYRVFEES